ncbi:type IV secretion system protein VirB8 [Alphaproteobacteria bacterium]
MALNMRQIFSGRSTAETKKQENAESRSLKTWYQEAYEAAIVQRNFFIIVAIASIVIVISAIFVIRYIKSTKSIEPFVIEIERKTGVPTVVESVSAKDYTADESIKRYFIMQYIKAREEYFYQTFQRNFYTVVRVLSSPDVYYGDYRPKFSPSNPNSPSNIYGQNNIRVVNRKSIIFQSPQLAQVRLSAEVQGSLSTRNDKVVLLAFDFQNIGMNDEERLINPLGFVVTMYKIEDENTSSDSSVNNNSQ